MAAGIRLADAIRPPNLMGGRDCTKNIPVDLRRLTVSGTYNMMANDCFFRESGND
jgi:hypothetical protein